jgi:regulatory protein
VAEPEGGQHPRFRRKPSYAERREKRARIDDPEVVLEAAARFLEARQRSTAEVRRRLTTAGYRAELIERAIERLTELGMLDDEAFARSWLESRDRARPRGERALRRELAVKGLERAVVDGAMDERELERPDADEAAARRLLARQARSLERVADPRVRRQRAYALLARSGFDPGLAGDVVREWAADAEAPPDD